MTETDMMQETKYKFSKKYAIYNMSSYTRDDGNIEILGLINDPNYDMKNFQGREMLFPKKWVALSIYPN